MATRPLLALALLCTTLLPAQVAPGLQGLVRCQDRNGTTDVVEGSFPVPPVPSGGQGIPYEIAVRVVPSQPTTVEGVEILMGSSMSLPGLPLLGLLTIYDEDPMSGLPGAMLANSGNVNAGPVVALGLSWSGGAFQPPVMLSAGTPYWISFFDILGFGTILATQNMSGPDVTPTTYGSPLGGVPFITPQINERVKLRLLSSSCPPPSNASVVVVGTGCPLGAGPTLLTTGLPLVGNGNFAFLLNGTLPSLPAALFWAPVADPAGTVVAASGCRLYLDLPGTLALVNAGLNPIQTAQTGLTGVATFPFPIPPSPALDGFSAAFQGVLIDPNGVPTATPGLSIALTPAVVATIGL